MSEISELTAAMKEILARLPTPPKDGVTEEFKRSVAKQKAIRAATHKTKKYAYYLVGPEGGFVGGKMHVAGEVVQMPVDKLPSKTWKPVDAQGVAVAEAKAAKAAAEAAEFAVSAADDEALDADELEAEPEVEVNEESDAEEPEAKPTPPAKPKAKAAAAAKPAPKKGKAGKSNRASDQDVA
jgi:hypothetical protein